MKFKFIKYKYLIPAVAVSLLILSCTESTEIVDQVTQDVTRGAALRSVSVLSNSVAINSATNVLENGESFGVMLEYQDHENGALLESMDVYAGFVDNTDDNGENSIGEILVGSIPASSFSTGDRGLPIFTYNISATEMQSAIGLASENIGLGGDQFTIRFAINLTDGRSFSAANNSGTLTGSYFASPFLYRVNVVCAPSVPTSGLWTVVTTDTWGDGWNGGALNIVIDGGAPSPIVNEDGGIPGPVETVQTHDFTVPDGAQTISIKYSSGSFDEEVSFTITSANGNEVVNVGPNPPVGIELLDYCLDNL